MCYGCWQEYRAPILDNHSVHVAATAIAEVYKYSPVGGLLHIVIDDWNLEDEHLDFCQHQINEHNPTEDQYMVRACASCLELLRAMPLDERASALALYEKFWEL